MSIRNAKRERTAAKALAAVNRIVEGSYTNKTLKKRRKVKLNQSTVEIEAGLSVSSLRNHPEILNIIENQNKAENLKTSIVDSPEYYQKNQVAKLKQQKKELQKQKKELTQKYQSEYSENQSLKEVNKEIHAEYIQIISALFDLIRQEDRQTFFEGLTKRSISNVVKIKK